MEKLKKTYAVITKIYDFLDDMIIENIKCIMGIIMIVSMSINVFSRWIVGRSFGELDEICLLAYVWLIFIGMRKLYRTDGHLRMTFIVDHLPPVPRQILELINALIIGTVSGYMGYLSVKLMLRSFKRTLNVTHIPYAFAHLAFVIGFTTLTVCVIIEIIRKIVLLSEHKSAEPETTSQEMNTEGLL